MVSVNAKYEQVPSGKEGLEILFSVQDKYGSSYFGDKRAMCVRGSREAQEHRPGCGLGLEEEPCCAGLITS